MPKKPMPKCPSCAKAIADDLDVGDALQCEKCGETLEVTSVNPVVLKLDGAGSPDDDSDEAPPRPTKRLTPAKLVAGLKKAYSATLPKSYVTFMTSGAYKRHPALVRTGYIKQTSEIDFVDADLLDIETLADKSGASELDHSVWDEHFAGYLPIASLGGSAKCFLVMSTAGKSPVYFLDYEELDLWELAPTFDAFVAGLGKAFKVDLKRRFSPRMGESPRPASRARAK